MSQNPTNDFIYVAYSIIYEDQENYKYADLSISRGMLLNSKSLSLQEQQKIIIRKLKENEEQYLVDFAVMKKSVNIQKNPE